MYISLTESEALDAPIKRSEVALRSFIATTLLSKNSSPDEFKRKLKEISISDELIYSRRFNAKLKSVISKSNDIYSNMLLCKKCMEYSDYNNDVPYVSELIDLILILFNDCFSETNITKGFNSVEEFHYCCVVFNQVRNNLSHPASRPIKITDASKVLYFIDNILTFIDDKYFWYSKKDDIRKSISIYKSMNLKGELLVHNLDSIGATHKSLLCRNKEMTEMNISLFGDENRMRLSGSIVLYGYGGVGKTAITTEFLYRIARDKKDGKHEKIDFILFFSSKDESLRQNNTTGEFYIDDLKKIFLIMSNLSN